MKKINDYLHLYIGCNGKVSIDYSLPMRGMKIVDCVLIGIIGEIVTLDCYDIYGKKWDSEHICRFDRFKPILRPLSDMTEEELQECGNMIYDFSDDPELNNHKWQDFEIGLAPEQFHWILSKHFDLFGLIKAALAISSVELPNDARSDTTGSE